MTRFQKKCLLASTGTHLFLLLLLLFGSAFFVSRQKTEVAPPMRFFPTRLIDAALAGGGGNPKLAPSDEVQKGNLNATAPPVPAPRPPVAAPPKPQQPTPPAPKPPVKPEEVKRPEKVEPPKTPPKRNIDLADLKPITRTEKEKDKARQEAEEQAARDRERQEVQRADRIRREVLQRLNRTAEELGRGLAPGTTVDIAGPGGEAFASYGALVQAAYAAAWRILPDLNDDDFATRVRVTISRDGRVLSSEILRRSGSALMDKSVQNALDKVKAEGLPRFPDFIKDSERTFNIEFNLKTRKLLG
jgi:TonB family protein